MNENVLVVPSAGVVRFLNGSCFSDVHLDACLDYIRANHSFRSRPVVEDDPSFKQVIPYVVIRYKDHYLLTRRTDRQTERRLHGKYSLGIGGHINDLEARAGATDLIHAGLERELSEEIEIRGERLGLDLIGLISDESTPVGRVHLGLVFLLQVADPEFAVREKDLMTAEWATIDRLAEKLPHMETWSQIVFENVISPGRLAGPEQR